VSQHRVIACPLPKSRRARERHALLLAVAVVFWLLAWATHLHVDDAGERGGNASQGCNVCVMLGAGAAPPADSTLPPLVVVPTGVDDTHVAAAPVPGAAASYRSRAPPV
jgi:hypothetical protein